MMSIKAEMQKEPFAVMTTENRGHTPEEVAELCVNKIVSVGDESHPAIQAQARAFKDRVQAVVAHYIKVGIEQDRATICAELTKAGQHEIADQLRRM